MNPFNSKDEGSKCESMTWQAIYVWPWVLVDADASSLVLLLRTGPRIAGHPGRGSHSSTFRLNVSTFYGIR